MAAHAMRAGTLFDPETATWLAEGFVLATHNQLPGLYCQTGTVDATQSGYPSEQLATASEGSGGGNVRSFFCTPQGEIVGYLAGRWGPTRYLAEARWARERLGLERAELAQAHAERAAAYEAQRRELLPPGGPAELARRLGGAGPEERQALRRRYQRVGALARLRRSHEQAQEWLGEALPARLATIEDEVYTRGAVG